MISRIRGTLTVRDLDRAEVTTAGGVAYEASIPLSVFERLPRLGEEVELRTHLAVREDAHVLYGFLEEEERTVFRRLLGASGIGPRLALAMMSALSAEQLVRSIRERDVTALTSISGVGKKTAERLVVDLAGKLDDVAFAAGGVGRRTPDTEEAMRALQALGLSVPEADRAVHAVLKAHGPLPAPELIRHALARRG